MKKNMVLRFIKSHWILILLTIFGFILRFYKLSDIPISLNHDETAIGYTSFSFLKTGADEYGKFFPLSLKSFGDWKLPFYPIIDMVPILFFGLTSFAVRFPSALSGVVAIPLIYMVSLQVFQKKNLALLAAFFMAVSPWAIFFSRIAYEANVATVLFLVGLLLFLKHAYDKKNKVKLFISAGLWGLTLFTYHAFVVFMPLFFIGMMLFLLKTHRDKKEVYVASSIFLFFVVLSAFATITQGSLNKLSTTSLFDDKHMLNERVDVIRGDKTGENNISKKVLHNKYAAVTYQIGQNYLLSFSPSFLFDKGGEKFLHNIGNFGNFYLFDALLLVLGIAGMLWSREKRLYVLGVWLLVGPIPSAITSDAPSSTRLFLMLPLFILITSYGAGIILTYLSKRGLWHILGVSLLLLLFIVNFIYFLDAYFVHMNHHKAQYFHYGYKEVVMLANKYPTYKIVMFDPTNFPYISFLFYNAYDPKKFKESVVYYPPNFGPFTYVKSFDRYSFVDTIDYDHMQKNTLYIDYRGIRTEDYKIVDPAGNPVFKYFFANK